MANNHQILPPNDPDLILSQKIGASLPDLNSLATSDNAFLNDLFEFKKSVEERQMQTVDSTSLWNSIESKINQGEKTSRILRFTPTLKRFAIAASILIAAIAGSFLLQNRSQPTLIGESYAAIKELNLTDGSSIYLRPYSRLFLLHEDQQKITYKLEGEAYFNVTSNPKRIFTVETRQSVVQVFGTKFVLSDWGNASTVYLEEGQIRFESLGTGNALILEPGQSSKIDEFSDDPYMVQKNSKVYTDWLNNELVFSNDRVRDIFNELEQHYDIEIESVTSIDDETISGSIKLDDMEAVLHDLELVLGGSFTKIDNNTFVFRPDS